MKTGRDGLNIPKCKSDNCGKSDLHYQMKVELISWIDREKLRIEVIKYDKMAVKSSTESINYQPDAVVFDGINNTWIEIETDPFNIFFKMAKLMYLENQNYSWPNAIYFGIAPLKSWKRYLEVYSTFRRSLKVNKMFLCVIDNHSVRVLKED